MSTTERLTDADARRQATHALDETVFVSAGAGAGKTRVLVNRISALVTEGSDPVPMRTVAAVTFTDKAAAEMRDRVRAELTRRSRESNPLVAQRAEAALAELDTAAIGTLHSFASRLLMENPIPAGLPPVISVLDEVSSDVRNERWWSDVRSRLLSDEATSSAMRVLLAAGVRLDAVREVAMRLQADWDLVEDRCAGMAVPAPVDLDITGLRAAVTGLQRRAASECTDHSDLLYQRIPWLTEWLQRLEAAVDDIERVGILAAPPKIGNVGRKGSWHDAASVKAEVKDVLALAHQTRTRFVHASLGLVVSALATEVVAEAEQRKRDGQLLFADLLVLARRMLRSKESARLAAHRRYRRLLLDEFQDTDPIQVEIAVRIVAGERGGEPDWRDCPVPAGSLFVVGDPKQSIYRFRRADIRVFLEALDLLAGDGPAVLSTNFRSHPSLLGWVNHVFTQLIQPVAGGQPEYQPLDAAPDRIAFHAGDASPRVQVVGADPVSGDLKAPQLREREAELVADAIAAALINRPVVEEREGDEWRSQSLEPGDVCVLVPARTSINELERALDERNVPYRTEASSLVYRSDEVRDVLLAARAVDDPSDELALAETLRTPLFGCGDDDLVAWKAAGGRWNVFAPRPEAIDEDHPVAESMAFLRRMASARSYLSPSELLATIVAERRTLEVATDSPRYRETWRRIRFLVDQARAWSEAEHGSLRDFLDWATRQAVEEERANEIVLPERDVDSIRILTVHAAKGLEFPMVVLSGMTSQPRNDPGRLVWPDSGRPEVSLGPGASSRDWETASAHEAEMLHLESLRLLYVAATRAESRLLVSLVRKERPNGMPDMQRWTRAELLAWASAGADQQEWTPDPGLPARLPASTERVTPPLPWEQWQRLHARAVQSGRVREADSATDIAHGLVTVPEGLELSAGLLKEPRDLELPAWLKGRYGVAVGRAVHATLQTVDLATGEGIDGIAEAQAAAESVADRTAEIQAMARAGLRSPVVRAAASRDHHKEMYVGIVIGGQLVEGYIDLLYRDDDGALVVIDYKTDAAPTAETVAAYQAQMAVYARALADTTGGQVSRCVLVFCREDAAVELDLAL